MMASPGVGSLTITETWVCPCLQPTLPSFFMFLSISVSDSALSQGLTHQTRNLVHPLAWPGPCCAAGEGHSVWGHRVLVPTVPGLEHYLFVPVALTSWPAERLTLSAPATPSRLGACICSEEGPPSHPPGPQFPQTLSPSRDLHPAPQSQEHFFFLGETHIT